MLATDMYEFRQNLSRHGIMFCYGGYMTEETLTGIGHAIKKKLEFGNADKKTRRSVFSVFVEQMQNVIRYSAEKEVLQNELADDCLRYGFVAVGVEGVQFYVTCANMILKKDAQQLRANLLEIQELDEEGLKTLYKEILRGAPPDGSKGAGVGFIEIARRASKGIVFDLMDLEGDYAFFTLKAYI